MATGGDSALDPRRALLRRQHEAEVLARVGRLINETLDLTVVSQRIADSVLELFDVHSSALRLFRPDGALASIALGGQARQHASDSDTVAPGIGLIGGVAAEGRAMWTADIREDPRFRLDAAIRARNAETGTVAGLAAPLRVGGAVIGVLSVGHPTPRAFTDGEVALLQALADQAAMALDKARLFAEADRRRHEAEVLAERLRILHEIDRALVAEQTPEAIAAAVVRPLRELLGVPRVIVNLFDLATGWVEWLAAAGRHRVHSGSGVRYSIALAGDVEGLRRGEPQVIDVHALPPGPEVDALLAGGVNVYMVVPMIAGGEVIGSVSLGTETGPFPAEQVNIAREAATQLAVVMAQARLHERIKRQAEELELRVEERTRELRDANAELGQEIAERRRAEAEAERANRAKSEFLSRMSHELRTPLNAILGFGQVLAMEGLSVEQHKDVEQILGAGRHLLRLIDEVLDISRIETGRLRIATEPVPVDETVRQAIALIQPAAAKSGVTVVAEAIDERLHVVGDRQRLDQVLLNLLSNAIKYNRPHGRVRVACARITGDRLALRVADTGRGIAADKLERLFTPFDRLGAEASAIEGTGLGLALTKSLVEAMGGTIRVESDPGTGSTFSVELAVAAAPAAADRSRPAIDETAGADERRGQSTVLCIEDNLMNLRLVEVVLEERPGITLLSATHAQRGLDLAREHRPDLILLDRHLPDIPGDEVLRRLGDDPRTRDIPVVVLSADAMSPGMQRMLDAGARAYLTKPIDVRELLAAVDQHLRKAPR